jgi:hypothetical protein
MLALTHVDAAIIVDWSFRWSLMTLDFAASTASRIFLRRSGDSAVLKQHQGGLFQYIGGIVQEDDSTGVGREPSGPRHRDAKVVKLPIRAFGRQCIGSPF